MKHAIIKFNSGAGALLCNSCSIIIGYGFEHEDKVHLCTKCKGETMDTIEWDDLMPATNFDKVKEFMEAFKQSVHSEPYMPDLAIQDLRVDLIAEELDELVEGFRNLDLVEVADALADLLYVVYGAAHACGIDVDACFNEVHDSNMSKLGADGEPVYREDGKVLKGPSFWEPNLHDILYPRVP